MTDQWQELALSNCFGLVRGVSYDKTFARTSDSDGLVPILRANNIEGGKIVADDLIFVPSRYVSQDQYLRPGDVLITTSSGSRTVVGKAALADEKHMRFAFGAFCSVARPLDEQMGFWLWRYAQSTAYRAYVEKVALGININNFRTRDLNALMLPTPRSGDAAPAKARLNQLLFRPERAREDLAHVPKLVSRYKGALLAAAFRGDLTTDWRAGHAVSQSSSWSTEAINSLVLDVRYGTAAKCHYEPKDVPVLRIPNVSKGRIDTTDLKYARFEQRELKKLALIAGDLLVIRSNGSLDLVGRIAVVPKEIAGFLFAGYLIRLRPDQQKIMPQFMAYAFEEPAIRAKIANFAKSTSGVNNINSEQLRSLEIPVPTLAEQTEILLRLSAAFASIDAQMFQSEAAAKLLGRLDQVILAKAFRGQL